MSEPPPPPGLELVVIALATAAVADAERDGAALLQVVVRRAGVGIGVGIGEGIDDLDATARRLLEAEAGADGHLALEQVRTFFGADRVLRILYGVLLPAAAAALPGVGWQPIDGIGAADRPLVDLTLAHWQRRARVEPALAAPLLPAAFSEAEFTAALGLLRAEAIEPFEALDVFGRLLAAGTVRTATGAGDRRYRLAGGAAAARPR